MQKIYYDAKNIEVVDISGQKDIEQLKIDFNCSGLVDVTAERQEKIEQEKINAQVTNNNLKTEFAQGDVSKKIDIIAKMLGLR